jgi:TPR repeat protein
MFRKSHLIQHNLRLGLEYMTLAAHQGHIGAMYALAVVHVEGYESYHSCTLSEKLFKAVLERGNTSRLIQDGYASYLEGRPDRASMYYAEAGILGNEVGQINGAILHDKYQPLPHDTTVRATLLESKPLSAYMALTNLTEDAVYEIVFEDLLNLGIELNRTATFQNNSRLSEIVATRLYQTASRDQNTFATVRLGDYYYYGKGYFTR